MKHKCKQRFTRIRQVLVKRKKIKLEGSQEYQVVSRKAEKREKSRLVKAEKAAVIENHITEELLNNWKQGKYNQIYNYPNKVWNKVLEKEHAIEDKEEDYNEDDFDKGYIENFSDDDDISDEDGSEDNDNDIEDIFNNSTAKTEGTNKSKQGVAGNKRKRPVKYEVEREYEVPNKNTNINYDF